MKRVSAILLTILMLAMLCMPFTAAAEDALEISIENATVAQGYNLDVPVTVTNNPGVFGIQIEIYYDAQVLRFDNTEAGPAFDQKMDLLTIDAKSNPVVIQYMADDIEDVTATGLLATIHFKAYVACKTGETKLTVKYKDGNNINKDSQDVPVVVNDATVTITDGLTSTDNPEDLPPKEDDVSTVTPEKTEKNNTWIYFVIGAVVLLVAVVLIWLFAGDDKEEEAEVSSEEVSAPPAPVEPEENPEEEKEE